MYIQNKPISAFFKLLIGATALILEWFLLSQYGTTALRLFPTWILIIAAVYFLSSALVIALSERRQIGKNICPLVDGMLIIAFALIGGVTLASATYHFYLPEMASWAVWIISLVLPVLTLLDWLLFAKKGRWHIMMPFYGLALPVTYLATMIFTAEILPDTIELRYPLEVLNFREFGLWPALHYLVAFLALTLIFGYILYIIDFAMSGKLSQHIVLPHLKVVEVDENGEEITEDTEHLIPTVEQEITETEEEELEETPSRPPKTKPTTPKPSQSQEPEIINLTPEDKQTLSDLGYTITEAIREEISKQEITIENEDETVTETIETTKTEITTIELAPDDEKSEPSTDQPTSSASQTKAKIEKPKPQNSQNSPKKNQNRPKNKPKTPSQNHNPRNQSNSSKTVNDMNTPPRRQKSGQNNQNSKKSPKSNRPKITRY